MSTLAKLVAAGWLAILLLVATRIPHDRAADLWLVTVAAIFVISLRGRA